MQLLSVVIVTPAVIILPPLLTCTRLLCPAADSEATYEEPDPVPAGVVIGDDTTDDKSRAGSSGISSGLRLENVSITFKNQQVLKDVTWEVKKGERVGLVGEQWLGWVGVREQQLLAVGYCCVAL